MEYLWIKSAHVMAVITWTAGFLLLPALAYRGPDREQSIPATPLLTDRWRRFYRAVMTPALLLTWVTGFIMIWLIPDFLSNGWMHAKLGLALVLSGVHGAYGISWRVRETRNRPLSPWATRTLLLLSVVCVAGAVILVIVRPF